MAASTSSTSGICDISKAPALLAIRWRDIVEAVQALEPGDFIKSEIAHNPPNSKVVANVYEIHDH